MTGRARRRAEEDFNPRFPHRRTLLLPERAEEKGEVAGGVFAGDDQSADRVAGAQHHGEEEAHEEGKGEEIKRLYAYIIPLLNPW